jgi:all-trans-retinol 13,14-reductase
MYITPPMTENDIFSQKMIVNTIMNFDTVRQWENTTIGKRGEDYKAFKKQCEDKILNMMEKVFPDFRSKIDKVFSSSPLTIRDYYGTKEGANYGTVKDCHNMAVSSIPIRTKIDNLLLTGQNINLHGILGVPLTAISTCGELLGIELLLNKINTYTS